jgi:hypothetical protein
LACGGGADGVEGGVSGRHVDGALSVVLALTDASGSTLRFEVDPRDGRAYLTVTFDGHEAPFELTPEAAGTIAGALGRYAAPVDLSGLRFVASSVGRKSL